MVQRQFDEATVLTVIGVSTTNFDTSVDALLELKKAGVSQKIIRAMLSATERERNTASAANQAASSTTPTPPPAPPPRSAETVAVAPAAGSSNSPSESASSSPTTAHSPTADNTNSDSQGQAARMSAMLSSGMAGMFNIIPPEQMPHVFLVMPTAKQEITVSTAQVAQTDLENPGIAEGPSLLRKLAPMALTFASIGAGPGGMMAMSALSMSSRFMAGSRPKSPSFNMTYVWGLPGRQASRGLPATPETFEVSFGDIPGVDPDEYEPAIVRLVLTKDNYRLIGATTSKMRNMMSAGSSSKWVSEDRWPVRLEKQERGHYLLHVDQAFEPGEFAVVLHPLRGQSAHPSAFGSRGLSGFGGPQLFYSAWDFSILSTPPNDSAGKK